MNKQKIDAIVLAGGMSKRFGEENKLLSKINNLPMILHIVLQLTIDEISDITIITGFNSKKIKNALSGLKVNIIENTSYKNGIGSTLSLGVSNLSNKCDGVLICLADMPLLTSNDYKNLINHHLKNSGPSKITAPFIKNKRGNPIIWGKKFYTELMNIEQNVGGQNLLNNHKDAIIEFQTLSLSFFHDIDTPSDYKKLKFDEF